MTSWPARPQLEYRWIPWHRWWIEEISRQAEAHRDKLDAEAYEQAQMRMMFRPVQTARDRYGMKGVVA